MKALAIAVLIALGAPAYADQPAKKVPTKVALLPLDADASLAVYGQPVASEISKTLAGAGYDVVVADSKMSFSTEVALIVDGRIATKGPGIQLTLRVRDLRGTTYGDKPIVSTAPALTDIDTAATDVAKQLVPVVKAGLDEVAKQASENTPPRPRMPPVPPTTTAPAIVLVTTHASSPGVEPLRAALDAEVMGWSHRYHHTAKLDDKVTDVSKGTAAAKAELGIGFEIVSYGPLADQIMIPMAAARVHVVIASPKEVLFDRIIVTDTVVGDKTTTPDQLAARTAREVLTILAPHVARTVTTWAR